MSSSILRFTRLFWRSFIIILIPLLLLPLIVCINTKESRCAYVILMMACFWMTEAVPMAVTSLIPVFGFPLLGVITTDEICYVYMKETNMMFIGGLMVAIAVEHCNLHKRIALFVILHLGQSPLQLMASFMITTMFLSMWISNTASTAMMIPIVDAILQEFYRTYGRDSQNEIKKHKNDASEIGFENPQSNFEENNYYSADSSEIKLKKLSDSTDDELVDNDANIVVESTSLTATPPNENCRRFRDMFFLATAYGANLGGTGSYTGSGTNLVLKGQLKSLFQEQTDLNFASWMMFNVPGMILSGVVTFIWLKFYFIGFGKRSRLHSSTAERRKVIRKLIQKKYDELGQLTFHEKAVLTWFIILVLLWFFLAPGFVPGWGSLFKKLFGDQTGIDDATPAILTVFILFAIPARPNFWCFKDPNAPVYPSSSPGCLTWKVVHEKIPWGIVLLMGGGFAIAKAAQESGLSKWLGEQLRFLEILSPEALLFFICLTTSFATEMTSNAATAAVLLPVLKDLSLALCLNPLFLMLPATISCSYAFMLPVATPPNALVYGAANIDSKQMIKAGFVPNLLCVLVITFLINTLGDPILNTNSLPTWINSSSNGQLVYC